MTERITTKLPKWPFLVGDISLLALAGFIVYQSAWPLGLWQIGFCLAAVSLGAWVCIIPFLQEFRLSTRVAEANALSTALSQIQNLEAVQDKIESATNHWTTIQEHASRTMQSSKELADRFTAEARELGNLLERANDREKAHLRLEVEKLHRAERDWLQTAVHILDHVYALTQAAARSGQPRLISQLNQFQQVCRESTRRLGLVAFGANGGDAFDSNLHQTADPKQSVAPGECVAETLASGFTFQGQLVRRALVSLQSEMARVAPSSPGEGPATPENANGAMQQAALNGTPSEDHGSLAESHRTGQKQLTLE